MEGPKASEGLSQSIGGMRESTTWLNGSRADVQISRQPFQSETAPPTGGTRFSLGLCVCSRFHLAAARQLMAVEAGSGLWVVDLLVSGERCPTHYPDVPLHRPHYC